MRKIGFIDYYLDEWHANNYPQFFEELSGGKYKVCYAYGKIDSPEGMTNKEWSEKYNIELLASIKDVVEKSDVLIVLSPDNPEMHEELSDLALKSGKPTYIDKTFAVDKNTAIRIFENADKNGTKCYSTSALRFATEWTSIDKTKIEKLYSEGPPIYDIYAIHQIEPIVMLMESRAKRVMYLGNENKPELKIEFEDGRIAFMYFRDDEDHSFKMTISGIENSPVTLKVESDFFVPFIKGMIEFFDTEIEQVSHEQTIDIMGILEAGRRAFSTPLQWINI